MNSVHRISLFAGPEDRDGRFYGLVDDQASTRKTSIESSALEQE